MIRVVTIQFFPEPRKRRFELDLPLVEGPEIVTIKLTSIRNMYVVKLTTTGRQLHRLLHLNSSSSGITSCAYANNTVTVRVKTSNTWNAGAEKTVLDALRECVGNFKIVRKYREQ